MLKAMQAGSSNGEGGQQAFLRNAALELVPRTARLVWGGDGTGSFWRKGPSKLAVDRPVAVIAFKRTALE